MPDPRDDLHEAIRAQAAELGFDSVGFTPATLPPDIAHRLNAFLEAGHHGDMNWLAERKEQRASPDALWSKAKSAIVLGMNYGPDLDPMTRLEASQTGVISVYGLNRDYHDLIKKKLKTLARWLVQTAGGDVKVFVDTAPVMEKPLAQRAGLGWQGKHTNLVSRDFGSWTFLGVILTTQVLAPDQGETDHCGTCRNCLDICPTDAFPAPYQLDARRCISYLTIEHKGPIPREFRPAMGNRIYGCDDCLAVCPWNKFARTSREEAFHPRDTLGAPLLGELATLDDAAFRTMFSKSPVKRIGRDRFVRNVAIALGNSGHEDAHISLRILMNDENPLVRGAAIWGLSQHLPAAEWNSLKADAMECETDPGVIAEWTASDQASTTT